MKKEITLATVANALGKLYKSLGPAYYCKKHKMLKEFCLPAHPRLYKQYKPWNGIILP